MTEIIWETVNDLERCRDAGGNTCSVKYFGTREAALIALQSLINCRDCSNCRNCWFCNNCSNCRDCRDCDNCASCYECRDCKYCSHCTDCTNCKHCYECSTCHNRFSLSLVTTLGKAYGTKTPKIIKNNFTFNGATYAIFWIALFCAFSLLTVALTFINGDLRLQLADEKERATFYRECLLSDKCKDLLK